MKKHEKKTST